MTLEASPSVTDVAKPVAQAASENVSPLLDELLRDEALSNPKQNTGFSNVASHFVAGMGDKIVNDPGSLAVNAAAGFGIGYLTKIGLESARFRTPTIGGLVAMGGLAAYELVTALPGWKQSYDIASDPFAHSAQDVIQAEEHIGSLGGGTLDLAAGGVAGGLAFKPSVAAATESLIARGRATVFGEGAGAAKSAVNSVEPAIVNPIKIAVSDDAASQAAGDLPQSVMEPLSYKLDFSDAPVSPLVFGEAAPKFKFGSTEWTERNNALIALADERKIRVETGPDGSKLHFGDDGLLQMKSSPDGRVYYGWQDGKLNEMLTVSPEGSQTWAAVRDGELQIPAPFGKTVSWHGQMDAKTGVWTAAEGQPATPDLAVWKGVWDSAFSKAETYFPRLTNTRLYEGLKARILPEDMSAKVADDALGATADDASVTLINERLSGLETEQRSARAFIEQINKKSLSEEYLTPGIKLYTSLWGNLQKTSINTFSRGRWEQYFEGKPNNWTKIVMTTTAEPNPVTVNVRDGRFFVRQADGVEAEWKGTLSEEGFWQRAHGEEKYATPLELATAIPKDRYPGMESGKSYAAQVDAAPEAALAMYGKREHFDESGRLVKMLNDHGKNYFRYDDEGNMVGWTVKSESGVPIEFQVTSDGVWVPMGDDSVVLWRGRFVDGAWRKGETETVEHPTRLMKHLRAFS